jgi:hypothetical protein
MKDVTQRTYSITGGRPKASIPSPYHTTFSLIALKKGILIKQLELWPRNFHPRK